MGLGAGADIDVVLEGQEIRKTAELKGEDGRRNRYYLYYDGESVCGKVRNTVFRLVSKFNNGNNMFIWWKSGDGKTINIIFMMGVSSSDK